MVGDVSILLIAIFIFLGFVAFFLLFPIVWHIFGFFYFGVNLIKTLMEDRKNENN